MNKDFKDIIRDISNIKAPKHLRGAVFARIGHERQRIIGLKKLWLMIGFIVSGASSIFAVAIFGKEFLTSDFFSIVWLSFSDMQTVAALWQDYSMSLLETLPAVSIALILSPIFIFLLLLRQYARLDRRCQQYSFKH